MVVIACPDCGLTDRTYVMKILAFPSTFNGVERENRVPQIKETCTKCNKYIRFAPQTTELIDIFNKILSVNPYITPSEERIF